MRYHLNQNQLEFMKLVKEIYKKHDYRVYVFMDENEERITSKFLVFVVSLRYIGQESEPYYKIWFRWLPPFIICKKKLTPQILSELFLLRVLKCNCIVCSNLEDLTNTIQNFVTERYKHNQNIRININSFISYDV